MSKTPRALAARLNRDLYSSLDVAFPDGFPLEERTGIVKLWDDEYDDGMRKAGWTCECDTFFTGPLLIEEVDVDFPHNPV